MDNERETAHVAEVPGGVQQLRGELQLVDDAGPCFVRELLRLKLGRREDHRLDHVDVDHLLERLRADIDREIDLLCLQPGQALFIDRRAEQGLAL